MLVFVTMQSSVRAEHCFRTGFKEYIHNVAIPEHEHVTEADGFQLAGSAHKLLTTKNDDNARTVELREAARRRLRRQQA